MDNDLEIEMMTGDFPLWRCLHDGPLSQETIDHWKPDSCVPWERYRSRNCALIEKLTKTYGTCAVLVWKRNQVIGFLRFYPKVLSEREGAGLLCFQQDFPAGPSEDFSLHTFPPSEELSDRTLKVHCLMIASGGDKENPYRHRGMATRMAERLITWAGENGWKHIEADAFEELPIIYESTGSTGYGFWTKLGFRVVARYPHPQLHEFPEFVDRLEAQALEAGIDKERAKDSIVMRLDLGGPQADRSIIECEALLAG